MKEKEGPLQTYWEVCNCKKMLKKNEVSYLSNMRETGKSKGDRKAYSGGGPNDLGVLPH